MKTQKLKFLYSLFTIFLILSLFTSCEEEPRVISYIELDEPEVILTPEAGEVKITVRSNSKWKINPSENEWYKIKIKEGSDDGMFKIAYEENTTDSLREASITVSTFNEEESKILTLKQLSRALFIKLDMDIIDIRSKANSNSINLITNVLESEITFNVEYETTADEWITNIKIENSALVFESLQNVADNQRKAKITLSYTDQYDRIVTTELKVNQLEKAGYDSALEKDFDQVKAMMESETTITEDIFIRGIIVANGTSENYIEKRYSIQNEENKAILFESENPIQFERYDKVDLWIKNCVVKEYSEGEFTYKVLTGISAAHIIEQETNNSFVPKEIYIKDLTDDYLFSLVKLKDLEFAIPFGGYTNFHEGYNKDPYKEFLRYYPHCIRDINGNNMYLLTNNGVSYRRQSIPQGSGSITGLVVREFNSNFGGALGDFSLRQLKESDISMDVDRSNGFSEILVEWNCLKPDPFTEGITFIPPAIGPDTANLYKTYATGFYNKYAAKIIYFGTKYRGDILSNPQGQLTNSVYYSTNWSLNNWWIINSISTVGISTPLSLQIETNSSTNDGPRDFIVEYSIDGTSWTAIDKGTYSCQGQIAIPTEKSPITGEGLPRLIPGFKIYDFLLPTDLLGQENIHIRLHCNSKTRVDGAPLAGTGGTNRLGHVSIKYNK